MPAYARPVLRGVSRLARACGYALLAFAAVDLGYRLHSHRPVLVLDDWRAARIQYMRFGDRGTFDPVLGWVPRAGYASPHYNTLDHGIRRNFTEDGLRTGGILAVGDAFTNGGPEVADAETWPAQLEQMTGVPVLNAGVPGYAIDQTVLRAEQLVAVARPRRVVIGITEEDIAHAGLASYGASKPYFTLDAGRLALHAPVPRGENDANSFGWRAEARSLLAHSALLDVVISRLAPGYWFGNAIEQVTQEADNDPVAVTCALLERLQARADQDGIRVLLFLQHAQQAVAERPEPGDSTAKVAACAGAAGMEIVDQLPALHAVAAADPNALGVLYRKGARMGEMSAEGNRRAAELLARVIGKQASLHGH